MNFATAVFRFSGSTRVKINSKSCDCCQSDCLRSDRDVTPSEKEVKVYCIHISVISVIRIGVMRS